MGKAFRLFPEIDVADWYISTEPKKKIRPCTLRKAKKDAIIDSADEIELITVYMRKCRQAC